MKHEGRAKRESVAHGPEIEAQRHPPTDGAGVSVVGIGASAGGLEALREFLAVMPAHSGMAFVVIQHLDPAHSSRTAEILAKHTAMPVVEAADGMPVQADHVYTNPANRYVAFHDGKLKLSEQVIHEGIRKPIDFLLTSLADDRKELSIGIILSGSSGTDGLRGVRAIRTAGGICLAQDPESARFGEMPKGIIQAGLADYVLPVERMPQALLAYVQNVHAQLPADEGRPIGSADDDVEAILDLLRVRTRSDFRHYKKATLLRRIRRRMGLKQIAGLGAYVNLLREDPHELTQLARDMLISVSSFFRDPEAFEELQREAIVPLLDGRDAETPLRAWVPGCATGEEAYSIAMLLLDATASAGKNCPVQVFASDVDEQALDTARAGIYPAGIAEDVSPARLARYFIRRGDRWQVERRLREAVVFSRHNLLADPPFSRLDLVSCRNVLIYLEHAAQKKVLTLFSFALNRRGYLFLGKAEGVAGLEEELYEPVSKRKRIYQLIRANRRAIGDLPIQLEGRTVGGFTPRGRVNPLAQALAEANTEALLRHFKSSLVLIEPKGRILYFHGETEKYLGHPKGLASLNLIDLTEGMLSAKLRRAIDKALQQHEAVAIQSVPMPTGDGRQVNLTVIPIVSPALGGEVLAVIFEDAQPGQRADTAAIAPEDEPLVAQLEAEVKALRKDMRTDAEEYGSSNEELKAANEEITSMNEELQSANEELEASKEELQSLNEELTTVNTQLNDNVNELTATNNDLANLISATRIATIFLDRSLRISRFTPRATELFNLLPSDVGRPIGDITQNFTGENLTSTAKKVLSVLATVETDVQTQDGRWFTSRVLPYRTLDDRIEGVVVTFSDVTRLKQTETRLQYERDYAQGIVETVGNPLVVLDGGLLVLSANKAFFEKFRVQPEQAVGKCIFELGNGQWDIPRVRELIEKIIPQQTAFEDCEVEHEFPQIGRRTILLSGRSMVGSEGTRILLAIGDITERKRDREALQTLNERLERRVAERTAEVQRQADHLRGLATELGETEQRERKRLATILHDHIQQLLVAARMQVEWLKRDTRPDRRHATAQGVDSILKEALEASRSLTIELSPPVLQELGLIGGLNWLASRMMEKHQFTVHLRLDSRAEPPTEETRYLLFESARELLFNAVKHSGVTEADVTLLRASVDSIKLVIQDEGKGFDPSLINKGHVGEERFGLFSVQQRLVHIGGEMEIVSAPGKGTTITLTIPGREPQARAEVVSAAAGEQAKEEEVVTIRDKRARCRVLIVDDHRIMREGLTRLMQFESDIEVVGQAEDGPQAISLAEKLEPDVIIMDVSLGEMNGVEATKRILARNPNIKIIGLSMHSDNDVATAMRDAGAIGYLTKGGPSEDLLAAIRTAFAG